MQYFRLKNVKVVCGLVFAVEFLRRPTFCHLLGPAMQYVCTEFELF